MEARLIIECVNCHFGGGGEREREIMARVYNRTRVYEQGARGPPPPLASSAITHSLRASEHVIKHARARAH